MRIKSRWFKSARPRDAVEISGAMAFIVWRAGQHVLRNMREADFDIPPGPRYFDFLTEWLIFLIHSADRLAFAALGQGRAQFTTMLAHRIGEILADNRVELLADEPRADVKGRFIDLLNLRLQDYAHFDRIDYGCLRYLAGQLAGLVGPHEAVWVHDQVMEIEAPQAVELIERGFKGLLDQAERPAARPSGMSGE